MKRISYLIGEFHPFTFSLSDGVGGDTAMADRSSNQSLDVVCLECKERLYLVLKQYEWLSGKPKYAKYKKKTLSSLT